MLKHVNIVGYVNVWKESSPKGWIDEKEKMFDAQLSSQTNCAESTMSSADKTTVEGSGMTNGSALSHSSQTTASHMTLSSSSNDHDDPKEVALVFDT